MNESTRPRPAHAGRFVWAAIACAAVLGGLVAPGVAGAGHIDTDAPKVKLIGCSFEKSTGRMSVKVRSQRTKIGIPRRIIRQLGGDVRRIPRVIVEPTTATIERRGDAIAVLAQPEDSFDPFFGNGTASAPASCRGGNPNVHNTDTIVIRNGAQTDESELHVDLTYGSLEPGLTDEGDGSSEIELDVSVGGPTRIRMGRGEGAAHVSQVGSRPAINMNAAESLPDADILLGRRGEILVDGAGAADVLSSDLPFRSDLDNDDGFLLLAGNQGDDSLTGSSGSDAVFPGSGADTVETGAGPDLLLLSGRAGDAVDCGPGRDFVVIAGRPSHELTNCEEVEEDREFGPRGLNNGDVFLRAPARAERAVQRMLKLRRD